MRQWYVAYTKPRKERFASLRLQQKGFACFLPMICEAGTKRLNKIEPLFPNYLFVHISVPEEYHLGVWTPGVKRFVSFGKEPTSIDDKIVKFLMEKCGDSGIIEARQVFKPGDEVTVLAGPFEGLAGVVERPPDPKGRVRVLMNILRQRAPVKMPSHWIKGNQPFQCYQLTQLRGQALLQKEMVGRPSRVLAKRAPLSVSR